ncbi:hypothetical protein POSPLADRAFT_1047968 [Postia placenta MAD-698-R-SB12]|uniref:Protein kinase domain-containing protein n=1 Tax=Postia placenta MAD-698-R-SB12 TaxID=670580 RepID=A0A1X6MW04_9APHY|nr:hypothetical protein POSPLADRAFT_1047968 [Postia placenta MAD-698-R-SB12]OSX60548.1 hypothetical protein POSPLADRAFT_1047968 [Postia placenta MAD-698-R-SB12]
MSGDKALSDAERRAEADELFGTLDDVEERWRDRQLYFERRGYMLRPRYRPGWVPSWRKNGQNPTFAEDAAVLPDDEDESISYMVMPFLRLIDSPPFETPQDVVEFVDQILEGLVFMHEQGVAHRDCTYKNIMMDASAMYPKGFHPVWETLLYDIKTAAPYLARGDVPVKYYYPYPPLDAENRLVVGVAGRDQEVPELSRRKRPYDPFKGSIFIGNLFRRYFHDCRPSASGALAQWKSIIRPVFSGFPARWRLMPRGAVWPERLCLGVVGFVGTIIRIAPWLTAFGTDLQG